jgi:RsiW-degrading membrane proteinase PrsW (M82 family)
MSQAQVCCICDHDKGPQPFHTYGGRVYCDQHFKAISMPHSGFWRAAFIQVLLMGVFAAVVASLANVVGDPTRTVRIGMGIFLAIAPTGLWLYFFYRQDRLEPEPKTKIAGVFLVALLLTDTLGLRIIDDLFHFRVWTTVNATTSLVASILIIGFTLEAIKYAAIRALVYVTSEFDERMDGIIYGSTAGLGVATLLNLHYIIDNAGVALAPGVIHVVTTALAQASFGGVLGYFMAQAKFEQRSMWWVPMGLVVSAGLNGLFSWVIDEVSASGLQVEPWRSLVMGLVVAVATFAWLVVLMRRANALTLKAAS